MPGSAATPPTCPNAAHTAKAVQSGQPSCSGSTEAPAADTGATAAGRAGAGLRWRRGWRCRCIFATWSGCALRLAKAATLWEISRLCALRPKASNRVLGSCAGRRPLAPQAKSRLAETAIIVQRGYKICSSAVATASMLVAVAVTAGAACWCRHPFVHVATFVGPATMAVQLHRGANLASATPPRQGRFLKCLTPLAMLVPAIVLDAHWQEDAFHTKRHNRMNTSNASNTSGNAMLRLADHPCYAEEPPQPQQAEQQVAWLPDQVA